MRTLVFLQVGESEVGAGADTCSRRLRAGLCYFFSPLLSPFFSFDVGALRLESTTIISGGAVKKAAEKVRAQVWNWRRRC